MRLSASTRLALGSLTDALSLAVAGAVVLVAAHALVSRRARMSSRVAVYSGCVLAGAGLAAGSALALVGSSTLLAAPLIPLLEVAGLAVVEIGLLWSVVDILLLRARFDDVATELASAADGFTVERGLATALGERFVAVGYHLPDSSGHIRADGELFDALPPVSDLRDTTIDRHGQAVAVIRHRATLDPDAVRAELTPHVLVALDNERLRADEPVVASDAPRLTRADRRDRDEERRRIERDLHDGAQQRVLAHRVRAASCSSDQGRTRRRPGDGRSAHPTPRD